MNIGLDFDDTITADVGLWELFVAAAKERGHDVRIVTFRFERPNGYSNDDVHLVAKRFGVPVIFCNGVQKDEVTRALGFTVDIWIDDFPVGIPIGQHLTSMANGVRINDDRKRTQLTNPTYSSPLTENVDLTYSDVPLQIGHHHG